MARGPLPEWKVRRLERITEGYRAIPVASGTGNLTPELTEKESRLFLDPNLPEEEVGQIIREIVAFRIEQEAGPHPPAIYFPAPSPRR